jgi:hypothetical protein
MQNVLRLTNWDDWEAYYFWNEDDEIWELKEQGHRVRVEDLLNMFGISLDTYEFDFADTESQAPSKVDEEIMKKIWEQN